MRYRNFNDIAVTITLGADMLINREAYIKRATLFRDTDLVKVVTGVRRCGKSSLLSLVRQRIESEGIAGRSFVSVNLEQRGLGINSDDDLYEYVKSRLSKEGRTYVFIDEVQRIEGWHDVVNSLRVEFDVDLYVTGSNAFLLSSELSTYLSGRYVEIKVLPLAFSEWCDFCGFAFPPGSTGTIDRSGKVVVFDDVFERYLGFGGMPALANPSIGQEAHSQYMDGVYEAVIRRDVLNRERNASKRLISDPDLLRTICEYLADTVGNQTAVTKVANTLTSAGCKTTHSTVASYIKALEDAYIVYPCRRYDIHGKSILKTQPKYYLVDTGLGRFLGGYRRMNWGFVFENAVFLQLLFKGWNVHVGKLYQKEVDFVATKDGRVLYVQATDEMFSESTRERELAPLRSIMDNHDKMVVVRQGSYEKDVDGIKIVGARDFFLDDGVRSPFAQL